MQTYDWEIFRGDSLPSLEFGPSFVDEEGNELAFADYDWALSIKPPRGAKITLTVGDGLTIDEEADTLTARMTAEQTDALPLGGLTKWQLHSSDITPYIGSIVVLERV
ncbi:hypothetical protein FHS85_002930 [Rhodoligotrophos appendicifer]|uniref:hypothetical protein n=1 Tax=Rhodoligotrophos appendicifer TaxID=987056 RepID=UPI0011865CA1|nr:hypothetical protein [Rhodoligotrophos appendicifer]